MKRSVVGIVGLLLAGLVGCNDSKPTTEQDMANPDLAMMANPDLAMQGPDMVTPTYNGCTTFMDQSAAAASRTVMFGGGAGLAYTPKCMRINAGQQVTFQGSFASHPLRPGVGLMATAGSPNNPIVATGSGTTMTFTFPTAGDYPYNCQRHDSTGMSGVVRVQ